MREELNGLGDLGLNRPAGEASLERSGSEASPAGAAGGGGPGGGPGGAGWEDPEPQVEAEPEGDPRDWEPDPMPPNLVARKRGALTKKPEGPKMPLSPQQKLLLLDTWQRSGLPARERPNPASRGFFPRRRSRTPASVDHPRIERRENSSPSPGPA